MKGGGNYGMGCSFSINYHTRDFFIYFKIGFEKQQIVMGTGKFEIFHRY
jgi:hypothetical protein